MNGSRGAKGSINDRLISMMYRNRYKKLQLDKSSFRKENKIKQKEFLSTLKYLDIDEIDETYRNLETKEQTLLEEVLTPTYDEDISINDSSLSTVNNISVSNNKESNIDVLHQASEKIIDADVYSEAFDFLEYDYYEIINKYTGVGALTEEIDPVKELEKIDNEVVIVDELNKFIDDSKKVIEEIKSELDEVRTQISDAHTEDQTRKIDERFNMLKVKIEELKRKYDVISEKYNFEDFEILASISMMSAIGNYRSEASLDEIAALVNYCKDEIESIDGIVIEEHKSVAISTELENKDEENKARDKNFKENKQGVMYLDEIEQQVAYEVGLQIDIIAEFERKLSKFEPSVRRVTERVYNTERMFGSFLRIAAGILTVPFSGRKVFGTILGLHLINRGVKGLNESLTPRVITREEIVNRYTSIEREILDSKDQVGEANRLVVDSIDQIIKFERNFKESFSQYAELIPEYKNLEKHIAELKGKLNEKRVIINTMEKDLDRQYGVNKVKVKKLKGVR